MSHLHDPNQPREGLLECWPIRLRAARVSGIRAWWAVSPDHGELARRGSCRIDALTRLDVAAALLNLPLGEPVAQKWLRPREVRLLSSLPTCVIEQRDGAVVRHTSPPLTVDHVVVATGSFRCGLDAVTTFSTYCPRSVLLVAGATITDVDCAEAGYYGVGLYRSDAGGLQELVAPESLPDWPHTPASWVFAERLAAELKLERRAPVTGAR